METELEYFTPIENGYTIYGKSGCPNCNKAKNLLKESAKTFIYVSCDEYLLEDKERFLVFIENIATNKVSLFPMIFYNKCYIGSFEQLKTHLNKLSINFDEDF